MSDDDTSRSELIRLLETLVGEVAAGQSPSADRIETEVPEHLAAIRVQLERMREAAPASETTVGRPVVGRRTIGPYEIVRELGRGGQGVVFLAKDPRLERHVALKVLRDEFGVDEATLKRFERESLAVSELDDPGLCTVYDSGVADGLRYIAMRYVEGESLALAIERRHTSESSDESVHFDLDAESDTGGGDDVPISGRTTSQPGSRGEVEEIVRLFERCARSLHVAHEAGVVHRDLKPGNIVVATDGRPVILDFGLAHLEREGLETLTQSGDQFGTPAYMSPEQVRGSATNVDRRTDVYSLGATLYECLVGVRPFTAPTRAELYEAICERDPKSLRSFAPSIPRDLDLIVLTALDKDVRRRYATAEDLADDLQRFLERRPVLARPLGPVARLVRFYVRSPVVAWLLTAAILGLVGTSISLGWAANENAEYERLADARRLEDLIREDRGLWPARAERVAAMRAWIRRAEELLERLPGHEAALARLRWRGKRVPGATVEADASGDRRRALVEAVRWSNAGLDRAAELTARAETQADTDEAREMRLSLIEHHAELVADRRAATQSTLARIDAPAPTAPDVWKFDDDTVAWRHEQLSALVQALSALRDDEGPVTIAGMRHRVDVALSVRHATVDVPGAAWEGVLDALDEDRRFDAVELEPIVGLVPLGADPASGLQEFGVWETGQIPVREANGKLVLDEGSAVVLVLVPGGATHVGSDLAEGRYKIINRDELRVPVTLAPYFIGKFEVTQAQWRRVMGDSPSHFRPPNLMGVDEFRITPAHPVESITWHAAHEFARRLGLVLPTESRWEHACRAGSRTAYDLGDDEKALAGTNLYDVTCLGMGLVDALDPTVDLAPDDGHPAHGRVDAFRANPWGLHSMHGNVSEWCADTYAYHRVFCAEPGDGANLVDGTPGRRAVRGGSFATGFILARSAQRRPRQEGGRFSDIGLRVARGL